MTAPDSSQRLHKCADPPENLNGRWQPEADFRPLDSTTARDRFPPFNYSIGIGTTTVGVITSNQQTIHTPSEPSRYTHLFSCLKTIT